MNQRAHSAMALVALVALQSGCAVLGDDDASGRTGDPCSDSASCSPGLECVATFRDANTCLPQPRERTQRTCSVDDDCRLSDGEQWPVEADCLNNQCQCNDVDKPCDVVCERDEDCPLAPSGRPFSCDGFQCVDDTGVQLVLDPSTCLCVQLGGAGDRCTTAATCRQFDERGSSAGLACFEGRCVDNAPEGASCSLAGADACAGTCFLPGDDADALGVCGP